MMALLKKIGRIALKVFIGLLAFVLFVIYVVIPVGGPWAIRSQGTKILKHPVKVSALWFNPVLMRLTVNGLKITDTDKKETLVGFKKFWVDVSFLSLLKKKYRVERIGLDGLEVNAALLPGNKINLMELVPAQPQQAAAQPAPVEPAAKETASASTQPAASAQALPDVRVDKITLTNGKVTFTDRTLQPQFSAAMTAMTLTVTNVSTDPKETANAVFSTKLGEKGLISVEANVKPLSVPLEMETSFTMNDYALVVLTPYVGKYTGRAVKEGGKMDLRMDYKISDNKLNARHKILIQKFDFGEKFESKDALNLPFGLAIALLEDPQGRISISLPVKGDMNDPQFEYFHLVGQVVRNFFMKLVTAPFMALLSMAGSDSGTEELGTVAFDPGKAELTDKAKELMGIFVRTLKERPKLSVEVNGSYDPAVDWKTIKTEAYEDEFARMRKESAFTDFELVANMYKFRFGMRDYWQLVKKFTADKKIDEKAMIEEMRKLIIEKGSPDRVALEALAQKRAQAVYDVILASGFDTGRIKLGAYKETQASMGQVPMEFTITVYEQK